MNHLLADALLPGFDSLPGELRNELLLQGLRLFSTLILLLLSWLIGQRIITFWEIRKRIQESDLESERAFQTFHGEFKALWRLWKIQAKRVAGGDRDIALDSPQVWDLVIRAARLEGDLEALLLKLASSRSLSHEDLRSMGMLRQISQQLREGMKRSDRMEDDFRKVEYRLFHELSAVLLEILRRPSRFQSAEKTALQAKAILGVTPEDLAAMRGSTG